jgi:hypothetical protein
LALDKQKSEEQKGFKDSRIREVRRVGAKDSRIRVKHYILSLRATNGSAAISLFNVEMEGLLRRSAPRNDTFFVIVRSNEMRPWRSLCLVDCFGL